MDAKITKKRLGRMLSYDWIKIVATVAAAIVVWSLVFTMTATRITPAQQFTVFNYVGNTAGSKFHDSYVNAFNNGLFSYEVLEVNCNDLATTGEYSQTVMEARLTTDEGDVIFVADADDESTEYEENGEKKYHSYLYSLVKRWGYYLYNLDPAAENGFFKRMETYLSGFYTEGYQKPESLDEARVEAAFRTRVKKDKRFKTEAQLAKGVQEDIARIKKYRDALENFYKYLDAGYVTLTNVEVPNTNEEIEGDILFSGVYGINLCPNADTMGGLKEVVYYQSTYTDEDGKQQVKTSVENMNVAFFNLEGVEDGFQYESLLYVNHLIESYCTELNA
ncbi:MAG: hypothetical protein IJX87_02530 [Clostridia bacterium]|nr:hypothetical protein [Clostridia bacterium]